MILEFKEPLSLNNCLKESYDYTKKSSIFLRNQKCDYTEYKTKLLNIEQMGLTEKFNESIEFDDINLSKSNEDYDNRDFQIRSNDDDEQSLFKFCNNLKITNLPINFYDKCSKSLTEGPENKESTSAINIDEWREDIHFKDFKTKDNKYEHDRNWKIMDNSSRPQSYKKRVFKDLHLRLDVVNKTFIRSIKRYYDDIWCDNKRIKSHTNVQGVSKTCNIIDRIWKTNFKDYFKISEIDNTPSTLNLLSCKDYDGDFNGDAKYADLKLLIACMTMPDVLKAYMKTKTRKLMFTMFSNVVYKYSHKNMQKLIENSTFKIILKQYVMSPDFELMLRTDETLKRYPDLYKQKGISLTQ